MSAFEGLRTLRLRADRYPGLALQEVVSIIRATEPDAAGHDYEAACALNPYVSQDSSPIDAQSFYQLCIEASIISFKPVWGRILTLGRSKFTQKLSRDEVQCFESAGLLILSSTPSVRNWWDRVGAAARMDADQAKLARAREAEERSLNFEVSRIASLGINTPPVWMSIEDNTAGYDIKSFDLGPDGPVARLIEVKSTIASPLRFQLTRNEWEIALKYGSAYHFHIWDMTTGQLYEREVADIQRHVPTDNDKGRWKNADIPVGSVPKRP